MSLLKTKRGKQFLLLGVLVLLIAVLSGCAPSSTVTHTTEDLKNGGFWQSNVVYYFAIALDTFAKWFNGQYGLAVLVMVIIVRTLILPLTLKQVRSSRAMQAIQPELQKIQKKYKDQPEKVQQETMRLFQENKVNPMAGCLPLIVQMPIFIALYNSIYYNPDLREHSFLWLQLGEPDKMFILPILAAATTFLQTRMMTKMNPVQQQGPMQFMMMVYPVLIFIMSYNFPAALPLYWFYSNVYTIIQNYFLYRNNGKTPVVVQGVDNAKDVTPSAKSKTNASAVKNNSGKPANSGKNKSGASAGKGNNGKGVKEAKKSK
ncbi:YidC/Oxa1 family membrane protein insertase [Paenibacillus tepidiphilus]|uniref:YidC/Oxa1 family membrane protein insertase n=1 Tax=Paenibacillus tepidiphilus TaxID=2608683 RepID=UPI00123AC8CD|nr:YidC/Oxa1 family membrane protein insertase [Paenibacillus tepidiphilus]